MALNQHDYMSGTQGILRVGPFHEVMSSLYEE